MTQSTLSQTEQSFRIPGDAKLERCPGCGKPVYKLDGRSGVKFPVEQDGRAHLTRCNPGMPYYAAR